MKRPYEMTLAEITALLGYDVTGPIYDKIVSKLHDLTVFENRTVIEKIDAAKAELAKPPKPEPLFLSEKAFLDASEG